jgi:hypothetical protein
LLNKEYKDRKDKYPTVGFYAAMKLREHILNLPPIDLEIQKKLLEHDLTYNDWKLNNIEQYFPENYTANIYKWMIENKGKYEIKDTD